MRVIPVVVLFCAACASTGRMDDLERAANAGNAEAQYLTGYAYSKGEGRPRDPAMGVAFYEKAAAQGHPRAQYQLGLAYMTGQGTDQALSKAGPLLVSAARAGHERASLDACVFYGFVQKDALSAYMWCAVASKRNPPDDQATIAELSAQLGAQLTGSQKAQAEFAVKHILGAQ